MNTLFFTACRRLGNRVLIFLVFLIGCTNNQPQNEYQDPRFRTRLISDEDYTLVGDGRDHVKFLLPIQGNNPVPPLTEACYFLNMSLFSWHLDFLNEFPEWEDLSFLEYSDLALEKTSRIWWSGTLRKWSEQQNSAFDTSSFFTFEIFVSPGLNNLLSVNEIVEINDTIKSCAPLLTNSLAFLPNEDAIEEYVRFYQSVLASKGVTVVYPDELAINNQIDVLSEGEAYGYLRVIPQGSTVRDYGPRDIVVATSAPNGLSIVAGLITANPQNRYSHLNLRLLGKATPNAVISNVYDSEDILALNGRLVRFEASTSGVDIQPTDTATAEAFWESTAPETPQFSTNLEETTLRHFSELNIGDIPAYGGKAANLGELYSILPTENRVDGFGIPIFHYQQFMVDRGMDVRLVEVLQAVNSSVEASSKRAALKEFRGAIRSERLLPEFREQLFGRLTEVFGAQALTTRIRFRSSSNAEDLERYVGAGIYDSSSGCLGDDLDGDDEGPSVCLSESEKNALEMLLADFRLQLNADPDSGWLQDLVEDLNRDLTEEKTVERAVLKVWASMWSETAFDERDYWGISHDETKMGIAVNPSFILEKVNAVAVTNIPTTNDGSLYRVISQVGHESVVQPKIPTATAEVLTFRRGTVDTPVNQMRIVARSSLVQEEGMLWTETELTNLAELLFLVQDHYRTRSDTASPIELDIEIKKTADNRIVIKQVRPYFSQ